MRAVGIGVAIVIAAAGCRSEGKADARASASADADASAEASADAGTRAEARAREVLAGAAVAGIGFAAVTRDSDVAVGGAGIGDLVRRSGVTGATVFEAASIAKLVVATCVMQLVEEGKLDLDVDASKYVGMPVRHPRSTTPITLRMLLSHRASIRDRRDEITVPRAGHELAAFLAHYMVEGAKPRAAAFLDAEPGTSTSYSNVGASLAALAVEHVAGASFAEVSTRRVLEPLGMRDASWVAPLHTSANGARPYAHVDGGFTSLPSPSHALYPSVDLHASARDLARFSRVMLRDGERTIGSTRVAGHEGEDAGATTALFLDLARGTGAVVLANGDAFASEDPARAAAVQGFLGDLLGIAAR